MCFVQNIQSIDAISIILTIKQLGLMVKQINPINWIEQCRKSSVHYNMSVFLRPTIILSNHNYKGRFSLRYLMVLLFALTPSAYICCYRFDRLHLLESYDLLVIKLTQNNHPVKMESFPFVDQRAPKAGGGPSREEDGIDKGDVHGLMMIIVWMAAGIIGLWALAFRQYRCSMWLHFFCMSIVNIITWMSGFLAITEFGVNARIGPFHTWWGITILILTALQWTSGIIAWLLQKTAKVNPIFLDVLKWLHRIFGFIIIVFVLVQILVVTRNRKMNIFIPVLVITVVSLMAYLLYKLFRRKMQGTAASRLNNKLGAPNIINSQELLTKTKGDYFVFADKVYDLHKVLSSHPGGYDIIKNIKGREVDRYIYGSEALESFEKQPIHHHTSSSMKLAGEPIGVLTSINPYANMADNNQVYLHHTGQPSKSKYMYAPYLASIKNQMPLIFKGYEDLSQLGKYFALTINNGVTKLYSVVNFLSEDNIDLMSRITGKRFEGWAQVFAGQTTPTNVQTERNLNAIKQKKTIPLLMKKYDGGKLTSKFLDPDFRGRIQLSKPLGRGLLLHQLPSSEVIFFAGGTGLNPFCDTIDLLYKQFLISNGHRLSSQMKYQNQILNSAPILNKLAPTLFYATRNADEMLELTAHQLNELSLNGIMNTYIYASNNAGALFSAYPGLQRLEKRFEHYVSNLRTRLNRISQIFVCGPPVMNRTLVKAFEQNNIPDFKYRIL